MAARTMRRSTEEQGAGGEGVDGSVAEMAAGADGIAVAAGRVSDPSREPRIESTR